MSAKDSPDHDASGNFCKGNQAAVGHGRPRGAVSFESRIRQAVELSLFGPDGSLEKGLAFLDGLREAHPDLFVSLVRRYIPLQSQSDLAVSMTAGNRKEALANVHAILERVGVTPPPTPGSPEDAQQPGDDGGGDRDDS